MSLAEEVEAEQEKKVWKFIAVIPFIMFHVKKTSCPL
jgi:hypothetical protein